MTVVDIWMRRVEEVVLQVWLLVGLAVGQGYLLLEVLVVVCSVLNMSRPEHLAPPEVFYGTAEAEKYLTSTRMIKIQSQLADRCADLLMLPKDESSFVLDVGCGTGLSGDVLTDRNHVWVGMDISQAMLNVAVARDVEGDLLLRDAGEELPFRAGSFDGAISVSAIQWLCNVDQVRPTRSEKNFQHHKHPTEHTLVPVILSLGPAIPSVPLPYSGKNHVPSQLATFFSLTLVPILSQQTKAHLLLNLNSCPFLTRT